MIKVIYGPRNSGKTVRLREELEKALAEKPWRRVFILTDSRSRTKNQFPDLIESGRVHVITSLEQMKEVQLESVSFFVDNADLLEYKGHTAYKLIRIAKEVKEFELVVSFTPDIVDMKSTYFPLWFTSFMNADQEKKLESLMQDKERFRMAYSKENYLTQIEGEILFKGKEGKIFQLKEVE